MPVLVRELSNAWRRSGEPSYDSASGDGAAPGGWTAAAAGRRIRTGDRRRGSPPGLPSLGAAARVEVAAVALPPRAEERPATGPALAWVAAGRHSPDARVLGPLLHERSAAADRPPPQSLRPASFSSGLPQQPPQFPRRRPQRARSGAPCSLPRRRPSRAGTTGTVASRGGTPVAPGRRARWPPAAAPARSPAWSGACPLAQSSRGVRPSPASRGGLRGVAGAVARRARG